MKPQPIYVKIDIHTPLEDVWEATQNPMLHEQWDLRFSSIKYLPKEDDKPQLFTYTRTVIPFVKVEGWGKSVGSMTLENGQRSSSLHFGTNQWFSPIREGKGYWQYKPTSKGVTFLTQYNYSTNFGIVGKSVDLLFRPLIGWATALSFDVLKRWLERGDEPRFQYIRFFSTIAFTLLFAFVWIYQGLVPKIIGVHPEEIRLLSNVIAVNNSTATVLVQVIGYAEICFGILWLLYRHKRHLFNAQLLLFPMLTITAVLSSPDLIMHPFNPISFNSALFIASIVGSFLSKDLPSAKNCKRQRGGK